MSIPGYYIPQFHYDPVLTFPLYYQYPRYYSSSTETLSLRGYAIVFSIIFVLSGLISGAGQSEQYHREFNANASGVGEFFAFISRVSLISALVFGSLHLGRSGVKFLMEKRLSYWA